MRRCLSLLVLLMCFILPVLAQEDVTPQAANACSAVTETTFTAEAGTVPANSQVAIENIYTGRVDYGTADSEGGFAIETVGLPDMPYRVYSAPNIPQTMRTAGDVPDTSARLMIAPLSDSFVAGGQLAYGGGTWLASGTFDLSDVQPGDEVRGSVEVVFIAPDTNPELPLTIVGDLSLQPILDGDGAPLMPASETWSATLTSSGLPILGEADAPFPWLTAITDDICVDAEAGLFAFTLDFQGVVPEALSEGWYQLVLSGRVAVADSEAADWYDNRLLSVNGTRFNGVGDPGTSQAALPIFLAVGPVGDVPMLHLDTVVFMNGVQFNTSYMPWPENRLLADWQALFADDLVMWDGESYYLGDSPGQSLQEPTSETLHILPDVLPGTPYEIGNGFLPGFTIQPVLNLRDAQADVTLRFYPLQGEPETRTWALSLQHGVALSTDAFSFDVPGHYVVEYAVRGVDADEQMWSGDLSAAGVVDSGDSLMVPQGARGVAGYAGDQYGQQQAWFDMAVYPDDNPYLPPIVNWPAFSGDVAYLPDNAEVGMQPVLHIPGPADDTFALFSAVRPDVRVRQAVTRTGVSLPGLIWRNDDLLDGQMGAGMTGNREGDLVFLFGGVVDEGGAVGGYASLAVITDDDETARVVPPFQQSLIGDESMLILPTTLRPGQVYTLGAVDAFVGQVAPTLPADVMLTATAPSGAQYTVQAHANRFGHVAALDAPLTFDEVGIWQMNISASFTGQTSASMITTPVTGGVPGVETNYAVYVVPEDAPDLQGPLPQVAPGQPVYLSVNVPEGWTDLNAHVTVSTASQMLDMTELVVSGERIAYSYSPSNFRTEAPNLEPNGTGSGPAAADVVMVTFAITGLDADGQAVTATHTYSILHDRVR